MKFKTIVFALMITGVLGFSSYGMAAQDGANNICPAVNCDCSALPDSAWQDTCRAHEYSIKNKCVKNNGVPQDFCALHGPRAKPLPLVADFSEVKVVPQTELKERHEKAMEFYNTLNLEVDSIKRKVSALDFKSALNILKMLDSHQDKIFVEQRTLTSSWFVYDMHDDASSAWKQYGKASEGLGEEIFAFGRELWAKYEAEPNDTKKKAYKVLAFKTLRAAGKEFEMAGHAYGGGNSNRAAAQAWRSGADVSKAMMKAKLESQSEKSHVTFYQFQAASRLHRASYYFGLDERKSDALEALSIAQEIAPNTGLNDLIASENQQQEKGLLQMIQ